MSLEDSSEDYAAQLEHMKEWSTGTFQICDALASGMMQSAFSTVFFSKERRLRFAGTIPFGRPNRPYFFYFFPGGGKPAICVTEMKGNLSKQDIVMDLPKEKGFDGTMTLRRQVTNGMAYIVACPNFTYDQQKYDGLFYLLTLGPSAKRAARVANFALSSLVASSSAQSEEEEEEEFEITGFLPC